jgi:transposase
MAKPLVSDELWELIEPLIPVKPRRFCHPGRKPLPDRQVLTGILFVLKTGIPCWPRSIRRARRTGQPRSVSSPPSLSTRRLRSDGVAPHVPTRGERQPVSAVPSDLSKMGRRARREYATVVPAQAEERGGSRGRRNRAQLEHDGSASTARDANLAFSCHAGCALTLKTTEPPGLRGFTRADDGTRTNDLLHGKGWRVFAPVRSRSLKAPVCSKFVRASERERSRANAKCSHCCHCDKCHIRTASTIP